MDDGSTTRAGASTPASRPKTGQPPGLRAQFGATVAAGRRLFRAHVDLAKAEVGEIVDEVKRMVALIGVAIGVVILAALLFAERFGGRGAELSEQAVVTLSERAVVTLSEAKGP